MPVDEVERFAEKLRKVLDEVDEKKVDEQSEAAKKRLRADDATTDAEDSTSRLSEEKYKPEVSISSSLSFFTELSCFSLLPALLYRWKHNCNQ